MVRILSVVAWCRKTKPAMMNAITARQRSACRGRFIGGVCGSRGAVGNTRAGRARRVRVHPGRATMRVKAPEDRRSPGRWRADWPLHHGKPLGRRLLWRSRSRTHGNHRSAAEPQPKGTARSTTESQRAQRFPNALSRCPLCLCGGSSRPEILATHEDSDGLQGSVRMRPSVSNNETLFSKNRTLSRPHTRENPEKWL